MQSSRLPFFVPALLVPQQVASSRFLEQISAGRASAPGATLDSVERFSEGDSTTRTRSIRPDPLQYGRWLPRDSTLHTPTVLARRAYADNIHAPS